MPYTDLRHKCLLPQYVCSEREKVFWVLNCASEMGIIMNSKGSVYVMKVLIMKVVVWLGWLSCVAVGQLELSEAVTGFVNFPEVGISCIGNLAVFITSISKGRLDLEMGARDVLATLRGREVESFHRIGLTTCKNDNKEASVVMLSFQKPSSSMKQFMKYVSNSHNVQSIVLQCLPLKSAASVADICHCNDRCKCILICTVEEVRTLLARRMPGILKQLPESKCLLPSEGCLRNGCHGCKEGTLYVERSEGGDPEQTDDFESLTLKVGNPKVGLPPPVCEIIEHFDTQKERSCICIPLRPPEKDEWTKLLTKSFRTKDNEDRKVSAMASDAMENYTAQEPKDTRMAWTRGRKNLREGLKVEFRTPSLLLPRLTEILINLLLAGWFRVDGFSTSMVARKAVKIYVVGSKESGFAANVFLSTALLKSKDTKSGDINSTENDTHICQLLTFRGPLLNLRTLSLIAGTVNLLCSIFWAVFMSFEGRHGKWYDIHYIKPSIPRVALIIVAIGVALGMDCLHLYLSWTRVGEKRMVWAVVALEITCIVLGSVAAALGVHGKKPFKKWVYSVVQALVWVKWGIGSYLLREKHSQTNSEYNWSGILVYSSSFFLNFMLAAVRCHWRYSPQT